jgi:hypothetical protein
MRLSMSFAFAISANSGVNPCKYCIWRVSATNQDPKLVRFGTCSLGGAHHRRAEARIFYFFRGCALSSAAKPLMQLLEEGGGGAQIAGIVTFGKLGINGREF